MATTCSQQVPNGRDFDENEQRRSCTALKTRQRGRVHVAVWARLLELHKPGCSAAELGEAGESSAALAATVAVVGRTVLRWGVMYGREA